METENEYTIEKDAGTWGMMCHLSALAGFLIPCGGQIIGPLVVWLSKRRTHPFVDECGKEAINFQISLLIILVSLAGFVFFSSLLVNFFVTLLVGAILLILYILSFILSIVAAVKATNMKLFHYPFTFRFVR